ncbi:hypothetical protein OAD14_00025 [Flavobacteriaceae bacterium]|nr:hypothetical protein [Flavobacteriaceae bacterium]
MQIGLLKIGDKMYNAKQDGFEDFVRYSFSEVVCLTKTLAVLKNGTRLVNTPPSFFFGSHWVLRISKKRSSLAYTYNRYH